MQVLEIHFLLVSPYLAKLAEEAKSMNGFSPRNQKHHKLQPHVQRRVEDRISSLTKTLRSHENPFKVESKQLFNLVKKKVLPEKTWEEICEQPQIGQDLLTKFCKERVLSNTVNLWSLFSKRNLLTWKSSLKKLKLKTKIEGSVVELSADRALFGRMIIAGKSRPDINLLKIIGNYELSVVPHSLFALDGTMHHCS